MSNMSSKNQNQSLQDNLDVQDYNSCQHLLDYKAKHGVRGFRVLQKCLWTGPSGKARIMRDAKEIPSCAICGRPHGRLYACVICASIGCWKLPDPHASRHAQTHPGHELAVDVDRAELFCVVCYDQIYDPDFDRAVICAQSFLRCQSNGSDEDDRRNVQGNGSAVPNGNECGASRRTSCKETESSGRRQPGEGKGGSAEADGKGHLNGFSQAAGVSSSAKKRDASCVPVRSRSGKDLTNGRKGSDTTSTTNSSSMIKSRTDSLSQSETWKRRRGAEYKPWVPTAGEELVLKQGSTPLGEGSGMPSGLRGLNNLGNTCFMNSVLQALLHTPPLRNYFLSDRHNRALCQKRASHLCLGCDMDTIFSAAFSGDRSPYSPAEFLYSWWRHAANLAGYEQQDAHEFFISTVDGIHANSGTTSPRAKSSQSGGRAGDVDCQCIVHRVFSGLLRSDVTCTVCGFTSTTHDPCVDISLDLEPDTGDSGPLTTESHHHRGSSVGNNGSGTSTLLGCLDRFTRQERLGVNEKFHCQKCQTRQESIKQMSVRKLPLVLCFHIKRFEHSTTRNTSRKVDRYMQFPLCLDMTPYLSSSIVRLRLGNRMLVVDNEEMGQLSERPSPHFELFAVVTHSGKLDSGHYVSYLRLGDQWYKCDDAWVTRVSEDVVRASQGYMLYYVQKKLGYKASEHLPAEKNGNHEDSGGVSTVSP